MLSEAINITNIQKIDPSSLLKNEKPQKAIVLLYRFSGYQSYPVLDSGISQAMENNYYTKALNPCFSATYKMVVHLKIAPCHPVDSRIKYGMTLEFGCFLCYASRLTF